MSATGLAIDQRAVVRRMQHVKSSEQRQTIQDCSKSSHCQLLIHYDIRYRPATALSGLVACSRIDGLGDRIVDGLGVWVLGPTGRRPPCLRICRSRRSRSQRRCRGPASPVPRSGSPSVGWYRQATPPGSRLCPCTAGLRCGARHHIQVVVTGRPVSPQGDIHLRSEKPSHRSGAAASFRFDAGQVDHIGVDMGDSRDLRGLDRVHVHRHQTRSQEAQAFQMHQRPPAMVAQRLDSSLPRHGSCTNGCVLARPTRWPGCGYVRRGRRTPVRGMGDGGARRHGSGRGRRSGHGVPGPCASNPPASRRSGWESPPGSWRRLLAYRHPPRSWW